MSFGALADRSGARRLLLGGMAIFVVASGFAATGNALGGLIAAQAALGVGAALLLPSSLTLPAHAYPNPARRAAAVGIWSRSRPPPLRRAHSSPVCSSTWVAGVRSSQSTMVALAALTFALIENRPLGLTSAAVLGSLALCAAAGAGLLIAERRSPAPMLPLGQFPARGFSWSLVAGVLLSFAVYGELFLLALYLQDVRGLTPIETGLVYLQQPVATALVGIPTGRLIGRIGPRLPLIAGVRPASRARYCW
jgi:DHA2 family methylenomycin A resistance protein-like MFS transporter